ncbi:3-isopropylmalate dehydrogenase [Helicobacter aurati]|uniref:3-isopropylmalate dehydrogenase n=1 Tax=Helicobacter aurati TaxID=137778 RepID=A0A3D8J000_9HELI|nr:3-isopropylmalate dehydrogenase [Helicobacter aurati]RDU70849.1 3-isopropylmalate dehydrogenase [Helicobacter aurati]
MTTYNIAILKGDGIGVEVSNQSLKMLNAIQKRFGIDIQTQEYLVGGAALDAYNTALPESTLKGCKAADAVLFGAIGGPKWDKQPTNTANNKDSAHLLYDTPEKGLLALRKNLQVYANIRPVFVFESLLEASTIKPEVIKNVDLVVVRELISGIYFGKPRGIEVRNGERVGFNTMIYSESEIARIVHYAFKLAQQRRKKLCVVDKANVLEVSQLWRQVVAEIVKQYNDIAVSYQYVDNASMQLIRNPLDFDVIVTNNLFGDILSDEASQLTGSIGLLPSASIGDSYALYEPIHGSAPDIAGQNLANPMASILSVAMMFENSFQQKEIAQAIRQSIEKVLHSGVRSKDLASFGSTQVLGCEEMGNAIAKVFLE